MAFTCKRDEQAEKRKAAANAAARRVNTRFIWTLFRAMLAAELCKESDHFGQAGLVGPQVVGLQCFAQTSDVARQSGIAISLGHILQIGVHTFQGLV
jgi:hypothetical protein